MANGRPGPNSPNGDITMPFPATAMRALAPLALCETQMLRFAAYLPR